MSKTLILGAALALASSLAPRRGGRARKTDGATGLACSA